MKILVFALTYNNADILPFWLRHYSTFADEISVWDDHSTDTTRRLLSSNPKVITRDWPHRTGIDEDAFLAHWQEWYPKARGHFDWVFIVDSDEFLYADFMLTLLQREMDLGTEVVRSTGYNMMGNGLPQDDGRQIYEINPMGVAAPVYSKPICFRPHIKIAWNRGKHAVENCNPKMSAEPWLKLLHYRYLGAEYTRAKNSKNFGRCGLLSGDKGAAWSCDPRYDGVDKEHSPTWAQEAQKLAFNVMVTP
jgi:hypothetical protein